MKTMITDYGIIRGIAAFDTYLSGEVKELFLKEENELETRIGSLIPAYNEEGDLFDRQRKLRSSLTFYPSGALKSVALEKKTRVLTPMGQMEAELVTFHEDGHLKRIFPLNGAINGYWTEEDEAGLAEPLKVSLPFTNFEAKVISLAFYASGNLRSLTLWPNEPILIDTAFGQISTRIGFSLYENGHLKSLEPAHPFDLLTPIGPMTAYDKDAIGLHSDVNSLGFYEDGSLRTLTTDVHGVLIMNPYGVTRRMEPIEIKSYVEEDEVVTMPIKLTFHNDSLQIFARSLESFSYTDHEFYVYDPKRIIRRSCTDCSSCGGSCS